jgi:hypothetical protein
VFSGLVVAVAAVLAVVLTLTSAPVSSPASRVRPVVLDVQPVGRCADVLFVGVRGSGESSGTFRGYGSVVGRMRDALAADLNARGLSLRDAPIRYPALGVESVFGSREDRERYLVSVLVGRDAVVSRIAESVRFCSGRDRPELVVLAGYSQGALAADLALRALDADALRRVVSVDVFGDPGRQAGWPDPRRTQAQPGAGLWTTLTGEPGMPDPAPAGYRSWCTDGDPVCAMRPPVVQSLLRLAARAQGGTSVHEGSYGEAAARAGRIAAERAGMTKP